MLIILHLLLSATGTPSEAAVGGSTSDLDTMIQTEARRRVACGPICLAYLLRRSGRAVDVNLMIQQARLSDKGMPLEDLIGEFDRYDLSARGVTVRSGRLGDAPFPLF